MPAPPEPARLGPEAPGFAAAFAAGLATGALPAGVTALDPDEAPRRFAVYRNNAAVARAGALGRRFPVIERLVGAAFFAGLARAFAAAHPPASPVLLEWGEAMPAFLAGFPPLAAHPYMADVARIELARGRAYHAADREGLRPAALAQAAAAPNRARLRLHPSVQIVASPFPAASIWAMNQPGAVPRPVPLDRPETALVLRDRAFGVPVHVLGPGDAAFASDLLEGATLLEAAASGLRAEPGHDPTALLALLARAGALIRDDAEEPA